MEKTMTTTFVTNLLFAPTSERSSVLEAEIKRVADEIAGAMPGAAKKDIGTVAKGLVMSFLTETGNAFS